VTINDHNLVRVLVAAGKAYQEVLEESPFESEPDMLAGFMLTKVADGVRGRSVGLVIVDKVMSDLRLAADDLQRIATKLEGMVGRAVVGRGGWELANEQLIAAAKKEFDKLCSSES
jgi:hypothetical protein